MNPSFRFERHRAFGWIVHRKFLVKGEKFRVLVPEGFTPATASDIGLWTKGRVSGVNETDGSLTPVKLPGDSVLIRGKTLAGSHLMTAEEDSEFWCINRTINRHRLPRLSVFDRPSGNGGVVPYDTLLCSGTLIVNEKEVHGPVQVPKGTEYEVVARAIGFHFKE